MAFIEASHWQSKLEHILDLLILLPLVLQINLEFRYYETPYPNPRTTGGKKDLCPAWDTGRWFVPNFYFYFDQLSDPIF